MPPWTVADLPDLSAQTFLITGANSGLGYHTAAALALKGATVLMACRSQPKAEAAMAEIRKVTPAAKLELLALDLGDLSSVRSAATALAGRRIDVLVNNAGVMAIPHTRTKDGFEAQLGTNHLGHYALTGLLLPQIQRRIVNVSSMAHRMGRMHFDDLMGERTYSKWPWYGQSKLANLLFTAALHKRVGSRLVIAAAHPGYADTNLQSVGAQMSGSAFEGWMMRIGNAIMAQPGDIGALPSIYAAAAPGVVSNDYYGPDGLFEMWGHPIKVGRSKAAQNDADAERLWTESERLTGVRYPS